MKLINLATADIKEERVLELSSLTQKEIDGLLDELKEYGYTIDWQGQDYIGVSKRTCDN